jgi:hypothetical protein
MSIHVTPPVHTISTMNRKKSRMPIVKAMPALVWGGGIEGASIIE